MPGMDGLKGHAVSTILKKDLCGDILLVYTTASSVLIDDAFSIKKHDFLLCSVNQASSRRQPNQYP